jgi:alkanesulfonate monooxygenase SsuD/methylene tetrahydromethanopterin reductase-like flavin-dependent oxidoreductase (luciferase family)
MEIGTLIFTKPQRAIMDTQRAEACGFTQAWFPDSHMIWGDAYACMALAAANTRAIKLATGISVASNRIPPVTVHSIATINEIAPGRVTLGYGTGHTGRRVMGLPPVRFADFREQVRVIRDLLRGGEAMYNTEGLSRRIRYLHRDLRFINLGNLTQLADSPARSGAQRASASDAPIPLYIAANGPKMLGVAGEFGDGIITSGAITPARVAAVFRHAEAGAVAAGRKLAGKLPCISLAHFCVLRPGESLESPRIMRMVGPWVMTCLHAIAAGYAKPRSLPADARIVYDEYARYVENLGSAEERYLDLHIGHCTYVPEPERKFVTPATIRATTLVAPRDEILERLHELEGAGLNQLVLNPPFDGFDEFIDEVSREIIARL